MVDDPLLTDLSPAMTSHNTGASILRQGMAVTSFSRLESYLGDRLGEVLTELAASRVTYNELSDSLRQFLVVEAVSGLANKLFFKASADKQAFAESWISNIAAFGATPRFYTALGFSPRGSNVGYGDVKNALDALGIGNPWGDLSVVASEIGASRISLVGDYKAMAKRRNSSAHNSAYNVPSADLRAHIQVAITIGIAADILMTSVSTCYKNALSRAHADSLMARYRRRYRFIDQEITGTWAERIEPSGRIVKRYPTEQAAVAGAQSRAHRAYVVVRNASLLPLELI